MTTDAPTLWGEAVAARDEALARVESHAQPWRTFADAALRTVALRDRILTSESVWDELAGMGISRPPEPRAMGVVMRAGIAARLIRADGWTTSADPKSHADPMRVYRSLVARR